VSGWKVNRFTSDHNQKQERWGPKGQGIDQGKSALGLGKSLDRCK
jgi:hypothetical protein